MLGQEPELVLGRAPEPELVLGQEQVLGQEPELVLGQELGQVLEPELAPHKPPPIHPPMLPTPPKLIFLFFSSSPPLKYGPKLRKNPFC